MKKIIIYGSTGVGKTSLVDIIEKNLLSNNLSYQTSDHDLFTSAKNFSKKFNDINLLHSSKESDFSIIVVNDNVSRLRVDFEGYIGYELLQIIFCGKDK